MLRAPRLHCPGADVVAPGAWSGPKVDKKEGRAGEGERPGRGTVRPLVRPFNEGVGICRENSPSHSIGFDFSGLRAQVFIPR